MSNGLEKVIDTSGMSDSVVKKCLLSCAISLFLQEGASMNGQEILFRTDAFLHLHFFCNRSLAIDLIPPAISC